MSDLHDLLVEIGTEELPPKSLQALAQAFATGVCDGLQQAELAIGEKQVFAAPRRLAVLVKRVQAKQPDSETERRGPAVTAAFDENGEPTKAAQGFARSCGVDVSDLQRRETDKGTWLVYTVKQAGRQTAELLGDIVSQSLNKLPVPKRMRWGAGDAEFVRPVHWVCAVFGDQPVDCEVMGLAASNNTRGHRFHAGHEITVTKASDYAEILFNEGWVVADFARRRAMIAEQVAVCAESLNGQAIVEEGLLDEVTALVEWPVAVAGGFEDKYLEVPEEALITTMQDNQKYFPLRDAGGKLMPAFITISNIDSSNPDAVRRGNERVVRPRLADALFFWQQDRKQPLSARGAALSSVLFQKKLGSLADKSARVAAVARWITEKGGGDSEVTQRAAELAKCDLLTEMVGEFPSLQGVMGEYYARHDDEPASVAVALREQYLPRFASDGLANSDAGRALAIAERIDTLVGIFAIGQKPTGVKDPFALRRAALGALRTLIECGLPIDLRELIAHAAAQFAPELKATQAEQGAFDFMMERLKGYYADRGVSPQVFEAVIARQPGSPLDFDKRVNAVRAFEALPESVSLAAANKRIRNILKKSGVASLPAVDQSILHEKQEADLYISIAEHQARAEPLLAEGNYTEALQVLAGLRDAVDTFFDAVMVMAEDERVRNNRLALLSELASLFGRVADVSCLSGATGGG